ncbi:MAG TPA: formate dehydrogenase subunit alpha [Pseudolabrys sp.]|nr:formate dehydrogenase subunit alpha [Pseudolabrys sp.]
MLIKRTERQARRGMLSALASYNDNGLDRRSFLRRSGLAAGGLATLGALPLASVRKAKAGPPAAKGAAVTIRKSLCTHCSVGCTVTAEVSNGVWIGQEPSWDSPINRGSHCAKGASVRELVMGERRLKYPMKLVNGEWTRIKWDQAVNEIGDKLTAIREKSGGDSVYWLGSAKMTNEGSYLFRKLGAYWGTNNTDHQARICHSTTVTGVANTWGYGAMTNSYTDIRNAKTQVIMGGNPAEAHPVSLQHLLEGKELNKANFIVIDPRLTRTAAHATEYVRLRPGTDIPVLYGMMWHIIKNGWEDKEFIKQRVYGFEDTRKEMEKWNPEEVERVSGVPGAQLERVAKMFATEKPSTLIWCMGQTQHTVGTANVRASCILLLLTGNVGAPGTGANIFRGHDNVQGATDVGLDIVTLPFYYGLVEGAWKHWSRVWETDYNYLLGRFDDKKIMETPGIPLTRWFDAVILPKDQVAQKDNVRAMIVQGHASNSITRIPESMKGLKALDLLVVADPHPTTWASLAVQAGRKDGMYLLPVATQFECKGSRVASNRALQWGEQIVKPIFESKDDLEVMYLLAKKLGFADQMFKNIKVENNLPVAEDILREMNRGSWSTGYCGQSPERLKSHMAHQADFDMLTQRAASGPNKGDYYGLPWPCWGSPEVKHPGTPLLYNTNLAAMDGGGCFRPRFGLEREEKRPDGTTVKVSLLADGSYSKDSDIKDGYPEFTLAVLKKLGWDTDLTEAEMAVINKVNPTTPDAVSWSLDLSGGIQRVALKHGCIPYGNGKARMNAFGLPDPIPVHREPIYTPRIDLVAKYPTLPDAKQFRLPNIGFSVQKAAVDKGIAKSFPIILSSGRLVEYEGGGEETRSNKWLAELQQDMFIEINTSDAADRGIKDGGWVWVTGAENASKAKVKALVTERVGKGVAWMPFHFGGWFQGEDLRAKYPQGTDPYVLGESANTIMTYGYDPATGMQEPKVTLCQIAAA